MKKNNDYWLSRQKKLYDQTLDELNRLIIIDLEKAFKVIYADMIDMYNKILGEDGKPLKSHLYTYNRYYNLVKKIQKELADLGSKEDKYIGDYLTQMYEDNAKIIGEQFNLSSHIDMERIKELCMTDWVGDGKNFSDRVWEDKNALANVLRQELVSAVATGKSIDQMSKVIMDRFSVEYYKAKRLCNTELTHIQIQSTIDKYKEAGINKIKIVAVMDDKTCEECEEWNDKIVNIQEIQFGVNVPPKHPNCRCSIVAVL